MTSTLKTLFWLERNLFHWEKGWNESRRQCTKSAQEMHQKVHKNVFYCTDICICDNFDFLFHFFGIWLSLKFKNFFIIKTLFQILYVFLLLYKDKLKLQHESATCLLCTNSRGGGSGGARGAMAPPIKFSMMLFFCKL